MGHAAVVFLTVLLQPFTESKKEKPRIARILRIQEGVECLVSPSFLHTALRQRFVGFLQFVVASSGRGFSSYRTRILCLLRKTSVPIMRTSWCILP